MAQDAIGIDEVKAALGMEQRLLNERYAHALRRATDLLNNALDKLAQNKASTHDGFNLGGIASEMQMIADQLEQIGNVITLAKAAR